MISGLFTKVCRSCSARAVVIKLYHLNPSSVVSLSQRQHVILSAHRTTLSSPWCCRSSTLIDLLPAKGQMLVFSKNMSYSWKNLPKPNVIFVLGGPGAGKGTQCTKICEEFGYVHLSAGDLLRKEQDTPGSQYGKLIDEHIRNGTIVPVEITCSLLEKAMLEHMIKLANGNSGDDVECISTGNFLIDGFPRNQNNLEGWTQQVEDKVNLKFVLFFECPKEECIERCLRRGKTSGRTDDNAASMSKRIDTYLNQTMPIIEIYQNNGLVRCINANRPVDKVFEDVRKLFN